MSQRQSNFKLGIDICADSKRPSFENKHIFFITCTLILAISIFLLTCSSVHAKSLSSLKQDWLMSQLTFSGNSTTILWQDNTTGNNEIYLKRSTDGGVSFDAKKNMSNNAGDSQFPQIESEGNRTFVVWQDNTTGNNEIYLKRSTDGGVSFDAKKNMSNNAGDSQFPQIESEGNRTFVVWQDNTTGNNEIYLKRSTDAGVSFDAKKNMSNNAGDSQFPQIESEGNRTFVVWQDNTTGNNEIYLKRSTDGGVSFDAKKNMSNNAGDSQFPQIESEGNRTFVVWQDNTTGNNEIYLKRSTDAGVRFVAKKNMSNNAGDSQFPQIESEGNRTFVVWQDNTTGNNEIYLKRSTDAGVRFVAKKNMSNNAGDSQFPQIESEGNRTFVVWQDNTTGNNEIYLKRSTDGGVSFYDPKKPPRINTQYTAGPVINDSSLEVNVVAKGINFPSHMAFVGPNDILVLEKNEGVVKRIVNGNILSVPLLDVNVSNNIERGMLGIAIKKSHGSIFAFLYFTESLRDGEKALGNRLYRYELRDNKLVNPKLLLDLPATPGSAHNGGKVVVGPDGNVYLSVGDVNIGFPGKNSTFLTKAQNSADANDPDGRAGILRITEDGLTVGDGILGNQNPLDKYYAYGIRNSFGMDFDPVTGALWDTENGPGFGDEINLVEPGFDSGWDKVQGVWEPSGYFAGEIKSDFGDLFTFGNAGHYRPPEISWFQPPPGLTALKFLNSGKMGEGYRNDLFAGDFHNGRIYHFELNGSRTGLELGSMLKDKIVYSEKQADSITFAQGFGGITDIQVGPDGYLYVLSLYAGGDDCNMLKSNKPCISYSDRIEGTIFKLQPK